MFKASVTRDRMLEHNLNCASAITESPFLVGAVSLARLPKRTSSAAM